MTKLEALIQLRDNVKAGGKSYWPGNDFHFAMGGKNYEYMGKTPGALECDRSYHGSLDAAKALHEAVLPGYFVNMRFWTSSPTMANVEVGNDYEGHAATPARAWLLAILEALISQEQQ